MNSLPPGTIAPRSRLVPGGVLRVAVFHAGGHLGELGILWTVLLIILWAAVVAALVLVMIELLHARQHPQSEQIHPAAPLASKQTSISAGASVGLRILAGALRARRDRS